MERRFDSLEEAEIYAARMRSEGYEAEVLGESIPTLWGAAAVGDVRVVIHNLTEEAAEESPASPALDLAARIIYGTVVAAVLIVLGWVSLELGAYLLKDGLLSAALKLLAALCCLYALAAWSILLAALFRRTRDPRSRVGLVVHAFVSLIAAILSVALLTIDFLH